MSTAAFTPARPATVQEKIERAQALYREARGRLLREPVVARLLETVACAASKTWREMRCLGVADLCRACAENGGGSCCGAGIENKYGEVLLLINLLMGVSLPRERQVAGGCFFLGPRGCVLHTREIICINYICYDIKARLSLEQLIRLQRSGGEEIDAQFLLVEEVKKVLRRLAAG